MPVCVVGMHRSGTSMVTRLLHLSGLYLGEWEDYHRIADDNTEGFWEHKGIVRLNNNLLAQLGGGWDLPPVLEEGWEQRADLQYLKEEARKIAATFEGQEPWGWKDPRNTLTLPFWQEIVPDMKLVICLRNPLEVSKSLKKRGFTSEHFGVNLWKMYAEETLRIARNNEYILTHYDTYFYDAKTELSRLLGYLEIPAPTGVINQAASTISSSLRHHMTQIDDLVAANIPSETIDLYLELCSMAGPVFQSMWEESEETIQLDFTFTDTAYKELLYSRVRHMEAEVASGHRRIHDLSSQINHLQAELHASAENFNAQLQAVKQELVYQTATLNRVYSSRVWKLSRRFYRSIFWRGIKYVGKRVLRVARFILRGFRRAPQAAAAQQLPPAPPSQPVLPAPVPVPLPAASAALPQPTAASVSAVVFPRMPNYDVLVMPAVEWDSPFQRVQQIASRFAGRQHRVLYLSPHPTNTTEIAIRPIIDNVLEIALPGSPTQAGDDIIEHWANIIETLCLEHEIAEAVCLVQQPLWGTLAFHLRERFGWKVVYDRIAESAPYVTQPVNEDQALLKESDLVLISSESLLNEVQAITDQAVLLPDAFNERGALAVTPTPMDALVLQRDSVVLGYPVDRIADWVDMELISAVAHQKPEWHFILFGSTAGVDLTPFEHLTNVHFYGELPYQQMMARLRAIDVCILPFKSGDLPVGDAYWFYESLDFGAPIVATRMESPADYEQEKLVYLAGSTEEFILKIEEALSEDSTSLRTARQQQAAPNAWEQRFPALHSMIRSLHKQVDIILITYNNLHATKLCLESIFKNTLWPNYRIVIVDNASADGTRAYLEELQKEHDNITLVLNETNTGFSGGNNQGIQASDGDYVVLLNNDTVVTRGWLTRLVNHIEADSSIGMIGPTTNRSGNESRIEVDYSSMQEMESFAAFIARENRGQTFDIDVLTMYCVLIRRDVIEEVGLLDERYIIGNFEDTDYSVRVEKQGYRRVCAEDVFIHHFGKTSFSKLGKQEFDAIFEENQKRFEQKWGHSRSTHEYRPLEIRSRMMRLWREQHPMG